MASLSPDHVAEAFIAACEAELQAPKPGNVHIFADGHGMATQDFIDSARAAAPFIAAPGARVGARILGAMRATWDAVGQNTNLGIVMLCAPLAKAGQNLTALNLMAANPYPPDGQVADLRAETSRVLEALDVADADAAFQAISLAQPAGLGAVPEHDVAGPASTTLLDAMRAAQDRDRIGYQYAHGFVDIFEIGQPALMRARSVGADAETATLLIYLAFLAAFPDSHIARKHGVDAAEAVRRETERRFAPLAGAGRDALFAAALDWDAVLKSRGLNPGTSADLTVATLFVDMLSAILARARKSG
jgi:triphosphoribosyl-dephospho-CoA synthase